MPGEIVLYRAASCSHEENSKESIPNSITRCLKEIFPLLSSSVYLPLLNSGTSSLDTVGYIKGSKMLESMQITNSVLVDFYNHVRDSLVLGLKSSLVFRDKGRKKHLAVRGTQDRVKIMNEKDGKGRKMGLRLKRIQKIQAENPEKHSDLQTK